MTETMSTPLAPPPVPQPVPLEWAADEVDAEAHLFPRPESGLPPRALCGIRWTVRMHQTGSGHCGACLTVASDQHAALASALEAAQAFGLAAGDHYAGMVR